MSNCLICLNNFDDKVGSIACTHCTHCDTWYHYQCVNLNCDEFLVFIKNNSLPWTCPTCKNNTHCSKCQIQFKSKSNSNEKSICCDICDKFYYLKCSGLTTREFFKYSLSEDF